MILADENVDYRIIKALREQGFKIISVLDDIPGITDKEIVALTEKEEYILLTEDKDFGKWVFAHKKQISVILLRYDAKNIQELINTLGQLLSKGIHHFISKFTTVTEHKIRQRDI